MLRAIAFDLDNTLIDQRAPMRGYLAAWLVGAGAHVGALDEAMARDAMGYSDRLALCAWLGAQARPAQDADAVWQALRAGLAAHVTPRPEITAWLEVLSRRYQLALVSSGAGPLQRAKLAAAALTGCFAPERVLISGELGVDKPDARIFAMTCDALQCDPHEVMFVGDHPVKDIEGAARAGMRTCWLSHGRALPDLIDARPDEVWHDIDALLTQERWPC